MKSQKEFFETICARFKNKAEMYVEVGRQLSVSTDTVSKWAYGASQLNYDRIQQLVAHFGLSPGDLFHSRPELVMFRFAPIDMHEVESYSRYIRGFLAMLQQAEGQPDAHISFHADELPIFHLMKFPRLVYFKLYSFAYDTLKVELTFEAFMEQMQSYDLEPVFGEIAESYRRIPSIEVWDDQVLDTLLYQIEHFDVLDRYEDPGSKEAILHDLSDLVRGFQETAVKAMKDVGVRFEFYRRHSPAKKGYMLLEGGGQCRLAIKADTINSMSTQAPDVAASYRGSFNATVNKSTSVGMGAERERTLFFGKLKEKIEQALGAE